MEFIWFILIGLVAGWLAGQLVKGGGFGVVGPVLQRVDNRKGRLEPTSAQLGRNRRFDSAMLSRRGPRRISSYRQSPRGFRTQSAAQSAADPMPSLEAERRRARPVQLGLPPRRCHVALHRRHRHSRSPC